MSSSERNTALSSYDDAMVHKKLLLYGEVAELFTVLLRRRKFSFDLRQDGSKLLREEWSDPNRSSAP